ncbi:MAG: hypothetical protein DI537_33605 [Stutzerimonas stutzeri]|nr:MAG: hypothetical protein DI537_33605 [Stutzerimonas stutzeri]
MTTEEEFCLNGEIAAIKATLAFMLTGLSELPGGQELAAFVKEQASDWALKVREGLQPHPLNEIGDKATMEALNFMFSGLDD